MRAGKGSKGDRLGLVDHSTINYPPFRKNFYIEVLLPLDISHVETDLPRSADQEAAALLETCGVFVVAILCLGCCVSCVSHHRLCHMSFCTPLCICGL